MAVIAAGSAVRADASDYLVYGVDIEDPLPRQCDSAFAVDLVARCADSDTCRPVDEFDLRLVFDRSTLRLTDIVGQADYITSFIITHVDNLLPNRSSIRVIGRHQNDSAMAVSMPACTLYTLTFERQPETIGAATETEVGFYWLDCTDNRIWSFGSDTIWVAAGVFDGNGFEISDDVVSPPTATGLSNDCMAWLDAGDKTTIRALEFRSLRLQLDTPTGIDGDYETEYLPVSAQLSQNYPNPFNSSTTIPFALPHADNWRLTILNVRGQTVRCFSGRGRPGVETVTWDGCADGGRPAASGVYLYRLETSTGSCSRRMILLK